MNDAVIDVSVVEELKEILEEDFADIIETYLEDSPNLISEIHQSFANQDAVILERSAHTLKSSSAGVGANGFAAICAELESLGKVGNFVDSEPFIKELDEQFILVSNGLKAYL